MDYRITPQVHENRSVFRKHRTPLARAGNINYGSKRVLNQVHSFALFLATFVVGCTITPDYDAEGSSNYLAPLPLVSSQSWRGATAGCEGLQSEQELAEDETHFGIAEGAPELVVVFEQGEIICVDTFAAVESELSGLDRIHDRLVFGYMAELAEGGELERISKSNDEPNRVAGNPEVNGDGPISGDPYPHPSRPVDPISGDPYPHPSEPSPISGDPYPHPSEPVPTEL